MDENEFKESLIISVKKWPCLYDFRRADYRDSTKKENAWGAVAFTCCSDGELCKKTWQNLRSGYRQSKSRKNKKSGSEYAKKTPWKWAEFMSFMEPFITGTSKSGSTSNVNLEEDETIEDEEHDEITTGSDADREEPTPPRKKRKSNAGTSTSTADTSPTPPIPKQKKATKNEPLVEQLLALLSTAQESQKTLMTQMTGTGSTNPPQADDSSLFADALAISLRGFSQYKRAVAKAKIQQLMLEIQFGNDMPVPEDLPSTSSTPVSNALRTLYDN